MFRYEVVDLGFNKVSTRQKEFDPRIKAGGSAEYTQQVPYNRSTRQERQ